MRKILSVLITCVLLLSVFAGCGNGTPKATEGPELIEWENLVLGYMLPKPVSSVGDVGNNFAERLVVYVKETSVSDYQNYRSQCETKGFTVDGYETGGQFFVYNADGYLLTLSHDANMKRMTIILDKPLEMVEFGWPESGFAANLPATPSNQGYISWNNEDTFSVKIGNMSADNYANYVDTCMNAGYNVDYKKSDRKYTASNEIGDDLTLEYKGNNIVSIYLKASEDNIEPTTEPKTETPTDAPVEEKTEKPASSGIRPEFKEAMDSYEAFFDEYVDFMKKYQQNPSDLSLVTEYLDYMTRYTDAMEKMNALDDGTLSTEESAYFIEVTARINKKLLSVAA